MGGENCNYLLRFRNLGNSHGRKCGKKLGFALSRSASSVQRPSFDDLMYVTTEPSNCLSLKSMVTSEKLPVSHPYNTTCTILRISRLTNGSIITLRGRCSGVFATHSSAEVTTASFVHSHGMMLFPVIFNVRKVMVNPVPGAIGPKAVPS